MTAIVEMKDVIKWFPPNRPVLDHLNLRIQPGEKIQITGCAGSGKTCLIDILSGNMRPDDGQIIEQGKVTVIPERTGWFGTFSVQEYMAVPLIARGYSIRTAMNESYEMMQCLDIAERGNIHVRNLTAFEKAVIMVGQALLQEGDLIAADTFMTNLNDREKEKILSLLLENLSGKAFLLMSDYPFGANAFDRVMELAELQGDR